MSDDDKPDFTIKQWCRKRGWGLAKYIRLRALGRGPAELRLAHTISITRAADAAWEQRWTNPQGEDLRMIEKEAARRTRVAKKAGKISLKSSRHGSKRPNRPHVEK
jgi:hypothetical protein